MGNPGSDYLTTTRLEEEGKFHILVKVLLLIKGYFLTIYVNINIIFIYTLRISQKYKS